MTGVERTILAHVQASPGVALSVKHALQAIERVSLECENPLVVGHTECGQGRTLDVRVLAEAILAVLGHDGATLFGLHQIPVVGTDERVDGDPVARCDACETCGHVAGVEFCGSVLAHDGPDGDQVGTQGRREQTAVGLLQRERIVGEPPHQQVSVGAQTSKVVGATQFHALGGDGCQGFLNQNLAFCFVGR